MSVKNIVILGVSGSIGRQTLKLIDDYPNEFNLIGASVNDSEGFLLDVIKNHPRMKYACVVNKINELENRSIIQYGKAGLKDLVTKEDVDMVVNAISGFAGLEPTLLAIASGKDIATANKESLVCGGQLIKQALAEHPVKFYPIDSEHSAIYQCLVGENKQAVKRLIITASGGPFRDYAIEDLKNVTVEQALKHPNWQMGKKITIDCATLVNKGLEIIEAHYLFDIEYDRIIPVLHYESIVHSLVEYVDGSIKAQLGKPSMETPILYAISQGRRLPKSDQQLDLLSGIDLHFTTLDRKKFPAIDLAFSVGRLGGSAPAAFSVANEVAVQAFLEKKIGYLDIVKVINKVVKEHKIVEEFTFEELSAIVDKIKVKAWQVCQQMGEIE